MGEVLQHPPCFLSNESIYQRIDFGQISTSSLIPSFSAKRMIEIKLLGCSLAAEKDINKSGSSAKITFLGQQNPQLWAVSGEASGIALQLLTETNTPIPYGSEGSDFQLIEGDNTLRFAVKLIANMNQITVGEFYSIINFTISYH
ncbi:MULTISPECIES: fimbrial protein [Symbiopectobacterium]|uniref:fimbrial protein n=1 Tax=Symbiopectobacterium TaxID=801 RepID=UPI001A26A2C2|nr:MULTISPECIES: fimbrial protein [Symbiopectobacterium]MBG6248202.1 type 1 fimbrial protein [Candidatus Symbiopectobacterium sp. PLON1]MBT9430905.1 type 1 fimbrial protein [Candidatus Symbiopectobacterium endolongispinus]